MEIQSWEGFLRDSLTCDSPNQGTKKNGPWTLHGPPTFAGQTPTTKASTAGATRVEGGPIIEFGAEANLNHGSYCKTKLGYCHT